MTAKARDRCNRWRNVTVAFRMSPEENEHLNHLVHLSGMTKQDYIIARLLQKEIVVHGNPRVYKALKERMDKRGEVKGSALSALKIRYDPVQIRYALQTDPIHQQFSLLSKRPYRTWCL